jgi:branched-chain amino acid transport system permease protein
VHSPDGPLQKNEGERVKGYSKVLKPLTVVLLVLLPPLTGQNYYFLHVSIMVGIFFILAQGLNILFGYTGQISIGHAAFYAIGAYASAILAGTLSFPFWVALLFAVLITGFIGFLLGLTCLRLRGEYLALTTVAFGEIVQIVLTQWEGLSGGPEGLLDIPYAQIGPFSFNTPVRFYYLTLVFGLFILILTRNLTSSKLGRTFRSIRDDPLAADVLGVNPTRGKLIAFVLSAVYTAIAGSLYAHYTQALLPDYFNLQLSVLIFMMVMLGGAGSLYGPVVGALLLTISFELLRSLQDYQMVIYGLIILLITIFAPDGLVGIIKKIFQKGSILFGRT